MTRTTVPLAECEPIRLSVCGDCAAHLANGEGGCCHNPPAHWAGADDRECGHGVRMGRQWRAAGWQDVTLGATREAARDCGCADDDRMGDGDTCTWFSWQDCGLCGDTDGGNREHATAWVAQKRPGRIRTIRRGGIRYTVRVYRSGVSIYATSDARRSGDRVPIGVEWVARRAYGRTGDPIPGTWFEVARRLDRLADAWYCRPAA